MILIKNYIYVFIICFTALLSNDIYANDSLIIKRKRIISIHHSIALENHSDSILTYSQVYLNNRIIYYPKEKIGIGINSILTRVNINDLSPFLTYMIGPQFLYREKLFEDKILFYANSSIYFGNYNYTTYLNNQNYWHVTNTKNNFYFSIGGGINFKIARAFYIDITAARTAMLINTDFGFPLFYGIGIEYFINKKKTDYSNNNVRSL